MRELALAVGVSRATLYRWVGDREHLLGEILWSLSEIGLAEAEAHANVSVPNGGGDWMVAYLARFTELTAGFEPIRRYVEAEGEAALRVLTSRHGVQQRRLIEAVCRQLERRQAAGELRLRIPPPDLAYVLIRVGESFIWRELITGDEPDLARATEVVRVLLS